MRLSLKISGYTVRAAPPMLLIEQNENANIFPVRSLWDYFKVRGHTVGPLFSYMDGNAVSRSFFTQQLHLSIQWANCKIKFYKNHSFRIGRATVCAGQGMSLEDIPRFGCWSSPAVTNYVRGLLFKFFRLSL